MSKLHVAQEIFDLIYPIGSIYLSANNTNPGTLFGGTWEAISQGRCIVGAGAVQANNDTSHGNTPAGAWTAQAGNMGGEITHTLSVSEMPSHDHNVTKPGVNYSNLVCMAGAWNKWGPCGNGTGSGDWIWNKGVPPQGGSQAHNNMPPYLVVYIWKRIT